MKTEKPKDAEIDFTTASERSVNIRKMYQRLEKLHHKSAWTTEEDMLAFSSDVGALGRLVMAAEGRWVHDGDIHAALQDKIAECLWWNLVLAERLKIDISSAFTQFIDKRETDLK